MSTDFKTLLGRAKLPERSVPVCMVADLTAQFEAAERELVALHRTHGDVGLEGGPALDVAVRMDDLQRRMQDGTYLFRLRGLPRPKLLRLVAAHPPRRDDQGNVLDADIVLGHTFDTTTMYDDLLKATVFDPVLTDDEWRQLLGDSDAECELRVAAGEPVEDGKLTDNQIKVLAGTALFLCAGEVDIPFSRVGSLIRRSTSSD
jgi:hypothetical protein